MATCYLASCGVPLLSADTPQIVGLSDAITCYISTAYFQPAHRLDDFLVHEAAHVFHNCKRVTVGLLETRRREWLLDIAYRKRETFAYACETYSVTAARLVGGHLQNDRQQLLLIALDVALQQRNDVSGAGQE